MLRFLCLVTFGVAALFGRPAVAADWGVAVQANEGELLPPVDVLERFAPTGGTVRDALGWHKVERSRGLYDIPDNDWELYQLVAAAGDKNVITLFSGNPIYGLATFGFPTTPQQIKAWANYAAYVVRNDGNSSPDAKAANVPNLAAVTIWNEFNGAWNGGIRGAEQQEAAMAALLTVVVPAIRAANPNVKIAAGAYVGATGMSDWFKSIGEQFSLASVDWLDVHPYVDGARRQVTWESEVSALRAAKIDNPFYFSEWGGPAAVRYTEDKRHTQSYVSWFLANVIGVDPVPPAGGNYFTLDDASQWRTEGLTTGLLLFPYFETTTFGLDYQRYFLPFVAKSD